MTQKLVRQYFQSKSRQLLASAEQVVSQHSGLRGSHREEVLRIYLADVLPKRFEAGKGMIYGLAHHSYESDIVIWDAHNYPHLQMLGHGFFFAESAKAMLEIKTQWSSEELNDILRKCKAVRQIYTTKKPNLADDVARLEFEVTALKTGQPYQGMVIKSHHIATSAIVFYGGQTLRADTVPEDILRDADDLWPDALLLLDVGRVILKRYEKIEGSYMSGLGFLDFIDAGEDSLAIYTAALLGLITERSVHVEDPFYLAQYLESLIQSLPCVSIEFPLTHPVPGRVGFW